MFWPIDADQPAERWATYSDNTRFANVRITRPLRDDEMVCSDCGKLARCETVDVGVPGHYMPVGPYICDCGWQDDADGRANVAEYGDYFP